MRGVHLVGSVLISLAPFVPGKALGQTPPPPTPPPATGKAPASNPIQTTALERPGTGELKGMVMASVLARVNGQPILAEEVMNSASYRIEEARSKLPPEQFAVVQADIIKVELEEIINRELLLQDAMGKVRPKSLDIVREAANKEFDGQLRKQRQQLNLKSDEELIAHLEKQGRSVDEMRRQFERSFMAMEYVRNLIRPQLQAISRQDLLDYYRKNPKEFDKPERVVWQHVFIDVDRIPSQYEPQQYAQMVLEKVKRIQRNEEFGPIAVEYSHGPSRFRNGDGEGNERGQIRPADLEEVVFSLRSGEVGPLVSVPNGFHVVRMVEHVAGGKVSFEAASPEIRRKLENKLGQAEYARIIKELRAKAYVENALGKK